MSKKAVTGNNKSNKTRKTSFCFYEFFAGGGMARAGLGKQWRCLFANDMDPIKASTYIDNWGDEHFDIRDVREIPSNDLPRHADLTWASFPCQDLSLAGNGLGIGDRDSRADEITRSGAVWPFLDLISKLSEENRKPPLLVLENVLGLLTLDQGRHFAAICHQLSKTSYRYGAIIVDAKHFLPQSRPRVFIVAVSRHISIPANLVSEKPLPEWHSSSLLRACDALAEEVHDDWVWWSPGIMPEAKMKELADIIDCEDTNVLWHSADETQRLIRMMAPANRARLAKAQGSGETMIGSLYLRMRKEKGVNQQRAEITFSTVLGCLRTPKGGASRPRIIVVNGNQVKTRLLSVKEAAALMGLPDDFILPTAYQSAFKVIGDGLAVPSVRFLAERILEPLVMATRNNIHRTEDIRE
ncbi:DNA (cytosine-5-)-methyltransferase [Salmonella enterica]|uniref:DNA (cytosine-5-)-methyltransferase n=3 Tax=Salmonella houtenae TaxID=59205 RepID=A0A702PLY1_SALHO|nr:DNA (cytosine-5-)-methyltransferase [Salmonella enterica subsp. houtenae]EAB3066525.1 DNA (cytosine-5-)-methyltransferase [Salmonella enterica]ECH8282618.1 DNA (cytosine-5-)-methyltransferase [Salmonella enterica subsp. enterica]EEH1861553.1 DNA (cytosine-5-)-methyltransferase [Salmonella enterica subsp. houtenae serovar 50:g,z51:-]ESE86332.1 DNA-cytosine methyltransferase [Salmonella enterica subsp. houtenae serovar 50:g,z51:- str. 01-0133]HAC6521359.1 DNA (cytosine-5-)-methyltransferase [